MLGTRTCLNAPCAENVHTTAGLEFGKEHDGKTLVIVRAIYGLNSTGKSWHKHFAKTSLHDTGFVPCKADGDVWRKENVKMKQIKGLNKLKDGICNGNQTR
jgi:hypothetical protein